MSARPRYVPSRSALREAEWRRSSHSTGMNNCVETAAPAPGWLAVRDSKRTTGPVLLFRPASWAPFVTLVRATGEAPPVRTG
ncbi:DUF397 domain-containing protein [Streptomyces sp. I05A-00742]|uniref:DUF397 domain-containing protein n=1 Tax=Streptomyces sp. I05A-00742 TaxID=2732853 RepID=UPI001488A4F8|nr:DUF397 domain-containing protein [Streptomyces sp. I05A-00742]